MHFTILWVFLCSILILTIANIVTSTAAAAATIYHDQSSFDATAALSVLCEVQFYINVGLFVSSLIACNAAHNVAIEHVLSEITNDMLPSRIIGIWLDRRAVLYTAASYLFVVYSGTALLLFEKIHSHKISEAISVQIVKALISFAMAVVAVGFAAQWIEMLVTPNTMMSSISMDSILQAELQETRPHIVDKLQQARDARAARSGLQRKLKKAKSSSFPFTNKS